MVMTTMSQTITSRIKRPKIYDGKKLWFAYCSWGNGATHDKLVEYARKEGMFDSRKGAPSHMGPDFAMWSYAFNNPEEAYPPFKKWVLGHPERVAEDNIQIEFKDFLVEVKEQVKRKNLYRESTIQKWCEKWNVKY